MLVIGLTGGIGSGKTTVAQLFAKRDIPIIDADKIAREITQPGHDSYNKILHHFAEHNVLLDNGELNRAKLRKIIFSHTNERIWLEETLHPLIRKEIEQQIKKISAPYCIVVIPLLMEGDHYPYLNRILLIDSPKHLQIERVQLRDGITAKDVEAIMDTQASRAYRLSKADDIIRNDAMLTDLEVQVEQQHQSYLSLARN